MFRVEILRELVNWFRSLVQGVYDVVMLIKEINCGKFKISLLKLKYFK